MAEIPQNVRERLERYAIYLAERAEMGGSVYRKEGSSEKSRNEALTYTSMYLGALSELSELFPELKLEEKLSKDFPELPLRKPEPIVPS
jgi:hypothetical protein